MKASMMPKAKHWRGWRSRRSDCAQCPISSPAVYYCIYYPQSIVSVNTPRARSHRLSRARPQRSTHIAHAVSSFSSPLSRAASTFDTHRARGFVILIPSLARDLNIRHKSSARFRYSLHHSRAWHRSSIAHRARILVIPSYIVRVVLSFDTHRVCVLNMLISRVRVRCPAYILPCTSTLNKSQEQDPGGSMD